MVKYREYYKRMLESHKEEFDAFKILHEKYAIDEEGMQEEFNKMGEKILEIINDWENRLCKQSEKGGYSQFTPKLAEKFRNEIKKDFPLIDHIGITYSTPESYNVTKFSLRRIRVF